MDVRLPDGTIVRNVPEGTTKAQLMAKLGQSPKPRAQATGFAPLDNFLNASNEALVGGLEGIYNAASAVTDPLAHKIISLARGEEAANRQLAHDRAQRRGVSDAASRALVSQPNPVARTAGRIGGSLVIPLPGKKLQEGGKLARGAYRAMQGAVGGAAVREVDEDAAAPAAIGAAANVVLPPVISKITSTALVRAAGRGLARLAAPVTERLGITSRAAPAPSGLAALGPEAEKRAGEFADLGVKPTTGMVTRDPRAWNFEQETAKQYGLGDDLLMQMDEVEKGLIAKGDDLVKSMGGAKGPEETGLAVGKALDAKRGEMQQVTGRLYDKVREERGDDIVGSLDNLRDLMGDPDMTDNATFDGMRESLSRRLSRLGATDAMDDLPGTPSATLKQAEELRKFIRSLGSTADPAVRMMRGKLVDALDDDVVEAVGDDAFKAARASAKARFDEFSKTFAGRIADEGIAPEVLAKRVTGGSVRLSEIRELKKSLLSGTDEQIARGTEAWNALKSQSLEDLLNGAVGVDGKLNGGTLFKTFEKQSAKFRELLGPEDFSKLERLVSASRNATVAPPRSAVNYSNTSSALANLFANSPKMLRDGWTKLLAKHGAAYAVGGAPANVALEVGSRVAATRAQQKAAETMMRRVELAKSPEAAARALDEMRRAAPSNPAAAGLIGQFLERHGMAGYGAARGAIGAEAAQ